MKTTATILGILILALCLSASVSAQETVKAAFEQPILISSAGQSADVKLVGMLAKRQKLETKVVTMATASDLEGVKTLVIVPGFSSKGLGAAGVSQKEEMDRVTLLVNAANEQGIPIVTVHVGGKARRGGQSDGFNQLAAESCKSMIVVQQGDEDKFFSTLATEKKIPITIVEKIAMAGKPLGELFQ